MAQTLSALRQEFAELWLASGDDVPPGVWTRREGEPLEWHERLLEYMSQGPSRSIERARRLSQGPAALHVGSLSQWREVSRQYDWAQRTAAWDMFCLTLAMRTSAEAQAVIHMAAPSAAWRLVEQLEDDTDPNAGVRAAVEILNRANDIQGALAKAQTALMGLDSQTPEQRRESATDVAEAALVDAVRRGERWAIELQLRTIGKTRGYIERSELSGKDGEALTVVPLDYRKAAAPLLTDGDEK